MCSGSPEYFQEIVKLFSVGHCNGGCPVVWPVGYCTVTLPWLPGLSCPG